jgi:hypothetical protein
MGKFNKINACDQRNEIGHKFQQSIIVKLIIDIRTFKVKIQVVKKGILVDLFKKFKNRFIKVAVKLKKNNI